MAFDANDYRKRVLAAVEARGGVPASDPFEWYDVPLDAADTLTDDAVTEQVEAVWAFWQKHRNHPKYRGLVTALLATHPDTAPALCQQHSRRQLAVKTRATRAQRDEARFADLDAAIERLVERFGGIPASKRAGVLAFAAQAGIDAASAEARLARHPVVDDEPAAHRPAGAHVGGRLPAGAGEPRGAGPDPRPARVRQPVRPARPRPGRAAAGAGPGPRGYAARNRELRPDRRRALVDDLLAAVTTLLLDGDPEAYLDMLAADVTDRLRPRVAAAVLVEDELTADDYTHMVSEAEALGLDHDRAARAVSTLARELGVAVPQPATASRPATRGPHVGRLRAGPPSTRRPARPCRRAGPRRRARPRAGRVRDRRRRGTTSSPRRGPRCGLGGSSRRRRAGGRGTPARRRHHAADPRRRRRGGRGARGGQPALDGVAGRAGRPPVHRGGRQPRAPAGDRRRRAGARRAVVGRRARRGQPRDGDRGGRAGERRVAVGAGPGAGAARRARRRPRPSGAARRPARDRRPAARRGPHPAGRRRPPDELGAVGVAGPGRVPGAAGRSRGPAAAGGDHAPDGAGGGPAAARRSATGVRGGRPAGRGGARRGPVGRAGPPGDAAAGRDGADRRCRGAGDADRRRPPLRRPRSVPWWCSRTAAGCAWSSRRRPPGGWRSGGCPTASRRRRPGPWWPIRPRAARSCRGWARPGGGPPPGRADPVRSSHRRRGRRGRSRRLVPRAAAGHRAAGRRRPAPVGLAGRLHRGHGGLARRRSARGRDRSRGRQPQGDQHPLHARRRVRPAGGAAAARRGVRLHPDRRHAGRRHQRRTPHAA